MPKFSLYCTRTTHKTEHVLATVEASDLEDAIEKAEAGYGEYKSADPEPRDSDEEIEWDGEKDDVEVEVDGEDYLLSRIQGAIWDTRGG